MHSDIIKLRQSIEQEKTVQEVRYVYFSQNLAYGGFEAFKKLPGYVRSLYKHYRLHSDIIDFSEKIAINGEIAEMASSS